MTASDNKDAGPSNEERMAAFFADSSDAEPPADYLDAWGKLVDVDAKDAEIRELESAPGGDALALRAKRQDLAQLQGEHARLLALAMGHEPEPAPMTETPPPVLAPEPPRAESVKATRILKRKALVREHEQEWPSIEADLSEASRNGLAAAAKTDDGWDAEKARAWADSKGKWKKLDAVKLLPAAWPGVVTKHTIN